MKKLTLISIRIKGIRYSRFVYLHKGAVLTENDIFNLLGVEIPISTTYVPGG